MSAQRDKSTEVLRELLDERGVEWAEYGDGYTLLRHGGREYTVQPNVCNRLIVTNLTPEQAIAATIGSCNCTDSERTDAPSLPYWWTHDGTLHIEATRMPTRIVVCEGWTCEFVPKRGLDASEAENAKLREQVERLHADQAHWELDNCPSCPNVADLQEALAENAKLRELCIDMWLDLRKQLTPPWLDEYEQRMRELGVEVDE